MNKKLALYITSVALLVVACTMTAQRRATNTIGSLEQTAQAAIDSYWSLVLQGKVGTNDVPKVAKAFDAFQYSVKVALDAVQYNTNALAPGNLVLESQDLLNLIAAVEKGTK